MNKKKDLTSTVSSVASTQPAEINNDSLNCKNATIKKPEDNLDLPDSSSDSSSDSSTDSSSELEYNLSSEVAKVNSIKNNTNNTNNINKLERTITPLGRRPLGRRKKYKNNRNPISPQAAEINKEEESEISFKRYAPISPQAAEINKEEESEISFKRYVPTSQQTAEINKESQPERSKILVYDENKIKINRKSSMNGTMFVQPVINAIRNIYKPKKIFKEGEVMIFFDEDLINSNTKSRLSFINRFYKNKLRKAKTKLKKRSIVYNILNVDKLHNLNIDNREFLFDNNIFPKFNELYYRLPDYHKNITRYYTYNNFIKELDQYIFDYYSYIFSNFGLRKIEWWYSNEQKKFRERRNTFGGGSAGSRIEIEYNHKEEEVKELKIYRHKKYENMGSINFLKCCKQKIYKYSGTINNLTNTVNQILEDNENFNFNYYKYNNNIKNLLHNRLDGMNEICYDIIDNNSYEIILDKMLQISYKFSNIGIKMNKIEKSERKKNNKYILYFYSVNELELKTLTDYINENSEIMYSLNLTKNDINHRIKVLKDNLRKEQENLEEKLKCINEINN